MVFNSYGFIFCFLPISIICYYFLNNKKVDRKGILWLIFISALFYGIDSWVALLLLIIDCAVNYLLSKRIAQMRTMDKGKAVLAFGVCINIVVLLAIRYIPGITLVPLGISFITFSQIANLVDVYRNKKINLNLQEYLLYILFFPKISSGPIVLPGEMKEQIGQRKAVTSQNMASGIYLFAMGLGKKVLVAESLAVIADWGWSNIELLNTPTALLVTVSYTLQIYFDFSGYSDMALGIARMMGFSLPWNFNSPYKATSIAEFWDRWHITLTRFFTKYLYIPLGGSRKGVVRTYLNVFIVFLVSGFWHGSTISFVVWGMLHGGAMVLHRMIKSYWEKVPKAVALLLTNIYVGFAWIFFRAGSINGAGVMIKNFLKGFDGGINQGLCEAVNSMEEIAILRRLGFSGVLEQFPALFAIVLVGVFILVVWKFKNTEEREKEFTPSVWNMILTVGVLWWCTISFTGVQEFVYSNF